MTKERLEILMMGSDDLDLRWNDLDLISFANWVLEDRAKKVPFDSKGTTHADFWNWMEANHSQKMTNSIRRYKINKLRESFDEWKDSKNNI